MLLNMLNDLAEAMKALDGKKINKQHCFCNSKIWRSFNKQQLTVATKSDGNLAAVSLQDRKYFCAYGRDTAPAAWLQGNR